MLIGWVLKIAGMVKVSLEMWIGKQEETLQLTTYWRRASPIFSAYMVRVFYALYYELGQHVWTSFCFSHICHSMLNKCEVSVRLNYRFPAILIYAICDPFGTVCDYITFELRKVQTDTLIHIQVNYVMTIKALVKMAITGVTFHLHGNNI